MYTIIYKQQGTTISIKMDSLYYNQCLADFNYTVSFRVLFLYSIWPILCLAYTKCTYWMYDSFLALCIKLLFENECPKEDKKQKYLGEKICSWQANKKCPHFQAGRGAARQFTDKQKYITAFSDTLQSFWGLIKTGTYVLQHSHGTPTARLPCTGRSGLYCNVPFGSPRYYLASSRFSNHSH